MEPQTTQYDPVVIQEFADRLYNQAKRIVIRYALASAVVFFLVASSVLSRSGTHDSSLIIAVIVGLVGTLIGSAIGKERAFKLRLEAQTVLCQARIEFNTRPKSPYSDGAF